VEAGPNFVAEPSEVFTQIEMRRQLSNRFLPRSDFVRSRRSQQPRGESVFASPRARRAQEFEERALPHQIEIVRVGVVGIPEALALRAAPRPAGFETGDRPFVERHGAQRAFAFCEQAVVDEKQHDEEQDRGGQPANR
jgi:hypothetical protein